MTGPARPVVLSVNVGRPREVLDGERTVLTGIWKAPAPGRIRVNRLNLEGDGQADLRVHGGVDKAVYAYPSEHYRAWATELGRDDLGWGSFGENLTLAGLLEAQVHEGDVLRIGSAEFTVTTPRQPCFKLGIRLATTAVIRRMWETGRCGFYLAVTREGDVGAGDEVALQRAPAAPSIAEQFAARRPAAPG